jgi:hypothetical protein
VTVKLLSGETATGRFYSIDPKTHAVALKNYRLKDYPPRAMAVLHLKELQYLESSEFDHPA